MSDLTRRVLAAYEQNPDLEMDTPEKSDAVWDLAKAAPILARQIEAVEEVLAYAEDPTALRDAAPLDPLADLTPGTILRDVSIVGLKEHCDAFILADARGPYVATAHGFYFLELLTAFTTDDHTIRYTRHGNTWTAKNPNGETDD